MARTGRQAGNGAGPADVETILSTDSLDRQVITVGPADGSDADSIGALTETAPASDTASSGLNGRLQRVAQRITSLIALLPTALGTGGGLKVDGSGTALPVSAASLPLPTGASTEATLGNVLTTSDFDTKAGSLTETAPATDTASSGLNGRLQRIAQRVTSLIALVPAALTGGGNFKVALVESTASQAVTGTFFQGTQPVSAASLPLPTGASTDITLAGVLTTSDFDTKAGSLTETAPATDTASSGLNGRLQRIAQRITSFIALFPAALTTGAGALKTGRIIATPSSTLTRPADTTAYAVGDLIGSSTTAGSVVVPSFTATPTSAGAGTIWRFRLFSNKTSGMGAVVFKIDLWTTAPTFTNGDNGAYAVATGAAVWLGSVTIALTQAADGAYGVAIPDVGQGVNFALASGTTIFWSMQTNTVFTPASSQTFTLVPEIRQD